MGRRYKFPGIVIASAGYDAQCEVLEIEFHQDGQIWQYLEVPEEIWYHFKCGVNPELYFHRYIKGCYAERRVMTEECK